jgi:hypothetical protein
MASVVAAGAIAAWLGWPETATRAEGPAAKAVTPAAAKPLIDSDFSTGTLAALGWEAKGDWDVFTAPPKTANDPGPVARFPANKPDGTLSKTFPTIRNPRRLQLSLEYGWGWGDASQPADAVSFMLLDDRGNGYIIEVHRCKARWAVQWGRVAAGTPAKEKTWAAEELDASHRSVRTGGGLARLAVTRESDGSWRIASPDWNGGAGASVRFADAATTTFSKLVLVGTKNFDDQLFNKIVLTVPPLTEAETTAVPVAKFLDSVGIVTTFPDRGQPLDKTVAMVKYCGFRWVRGGIEGLTEKGPTTLRTYLDLHEQTGARFSWGLVSGGSDLEKLIETARPLAKAGALLAFEGNNEPNNWGVTYQGEKGGGKAPSWRAVAKLQRDLYAAVKADPLLKAYPVWSASEIGGEIDDVGLQFLKVPAGRRTLMPEGTTYADAANVHNYIYHPGSPGLADNKAWNAADPTSACRIDGLFANHGVTWAKHFRGYSEDELMTLPRVTTETGCTIGGVITEEIHARDLLNMYLAQFKRGWSHTAVYLLRDRTDEGGNQAFGYFKADYTPRKAAVYLHNLTTILAGRGTAARPGRLAYSIPEQPATVHDLLLQKADGTFVLVVWGERLEGSDEVTVHLGAEFPEVRVYDPTKGTEPVETRSRVAELKLKVSDHPLVLVLGAK